METRRDKINKLKEILRGAHQKRSRLVQLASDGKYYLLQDLVAVSYSMEFNTREEMDAWIRKEGDYGWCKSKSNRTYSIILHFEFVPEAGALPQIKERNTVFMGNDANPTPEYAARIEAQQRIAQRYIREQPKGFVMKRHDEKIKWD